MPRDSAMYLDDIGIACEKIIRFTDGMSQTDFAGDEKTFDAVVRNLEIIGEAAKHLPNEIQAAMPGINWRGASGLRDMLAHAYFGIDEDILWDVVQNKIPPLLKAITDFPGN